MKLMTSTATVNQPEKGRLARREAQRQAAMAEAHEAATRRVARAKGITLSQHIEAAKVKLATTAANARAILDTLSPSDLNIYLLAEELGQNRKTVLQGYPKPGAALRAKYEQESGPGPRTADS